MLSILLTLVVLHLLTTSWSVTRQYLLASKIELGLFSTVWATMNCVVGTLMGYLLSVRYIAKESYKTYRRAFISKKALKEELKDSDDTLAFLKEFLAESGLDVDIKIVDSSELDKEEEKE